jgi:hypothetical protein
MEEVSPVASGVDAGMFGTGSGGECGSGVVGSGGSREEFALGGGEGWHVVDAVPEAQRQCGFGGDSVGSEDGEEGEESLVDGVGGVDERGDRNGW